MVYILCIMLLGSCMFQNTRYTKHDVFVYRVPNSTPIHVFRYALIVRYYTVLQYYSITVLQYYSITVLQYYSITVLQYYSITVLQYYSSVLLHTVTLVLQIKIIGTSVQLQKCLIADL